MVYVSPAWALSTQPHDVHTCWSPAEATQQLIKKEAAERLAEEAEEAARVAREEEQRRRKTREEHERKVVEARRIKEVGIAGHFGMLFDSLEHRTQEVPVRDQYTRGARGRLLVVRCPTVQLMLGMKYPSVVLGACPVSAPFPQAAEAAERAKEETEAAERKRVKDEADAKAKAAADAIATIKAEEAAMQAQFAAERASACPLLVHGCPPETLTN